MMFLEFFLCYKNGNGDVNNWKIFERELRKFLFFALQGKNEFLLNKFCSLILNYSLKDHGFRKFNKI